MNLPKELHGDPEFEEMARFLENKSEEFGVKMMLLIDSSLCKSCQIKLLISLICADASLVYHYTKNKEKAIEAIHEITSLSITKFLQDGDRVEMELKELYKKEKPQTSQEVADLLTNYIENNGKIH